MRAFIVGLCVLVMLVGSSTAFGQSDQERAAARSLATEGISDYKKGDTAQAVDKLERAYQLAPIPTIGLWSARALEKSGKLVEASERLIAVGRFDVTKDDPEVFTKAQADAEKMKSELTPRIPQLTIELLNGEGKQVTVDLDGETLKSALVGVPFDVNPGKRTVTARAGSGQVKREVLVAEGAASRIVLDLSELPATASAAPAAAATDDEPAGAGAPVSSAERPIVDQGSSSGQRVAGYIVLGVGGAALVAGTIFGAKAIEQHSLYEDRCPNGQCSSEYQQYYDTFQTNRKVAIVGLSVGAVGVVTGLYLVLSAHDEPSTEEAYVRPWIGLGSLGAEGRF